jgi:UDP-sulfoquinovose synthase
LKIIVLGGDGFCGWPTALKLAREEHQVLILDNLSRRLIDEELKTNSLTDIASIETRVSTAQNHAMDIECKRVDLRHYESVVSEFNDFQPDAVVHFAEQRSAPYSMIGSKERRFTVENNICVTHNILNAIVECKPDIHLVHLGTMGVYGYSKDFGSIPEGYLNIKINSTEKDADILYPTQPGSVYHMTKSLDQLLFQFYVKNWGIKITDLHQGIVWGTQTEETMLAPELINRFDYDGVFGTVLNRFIVQAANDHPISVYGTGGQKRAFIHISDTAKCVQLAIENPPYGEQIKTRIFNQVSEVRQVKELAFMCGGKEIEFLSNPRKELSENELEVSNEGLKSLGFEPVLLSEELMNDVSFIAKQGKFNKETVLTSPNW